MENEQYWGFLISFAAGQYSFFWSLDGRMCVDLEEQYCIELRSRDFLFLFCYKINTRIKTSKQKNQPLYYEKQTEGFLFAVVFFSSFERAGLKKIIKQQQNQHELRLFFLYSKPHDESKENPRSTPFPVSSPAAL